MKTAENLYCQEVDTVFLCNVQKAIRDVSLLLDNRVLDNLLKNEDKFLPSSRYFTYIQTDIEPWMRINVAKWMLDVCDEQKCEEDVFPLALNFMDRILSIHDITRQKLQLLGTACIFVASKVKETVPLTSEILIAYTDFSIILNDLLECELLVIRTLQWKLGVVLPHDMLDQLIWRLPAMSKAIGGLEPGADTIRRHCIRLLNLCYAQDYTMTQYPASLVAAASIHAAAYELLGPSKCVLYALLQRLHALTHSDIDCLLACQEKMQRCYADHKAHEQSKSSENSAGSDHKRSSRDTKGEPTTPTDVRHIQA